MEGNAEESARIAHGTSCTRESDHRGPRQRITGNRIPDYALEKKTVGIDSDTRHLSPDRESNRGQNQQYRNPAYGHMEMNDYLCMILNKREGRHVGVRLYLS